VELDRGLEPVLADVLAGIDNVRVHYGDILKTDVIALVREVFGGGDYRVVANLPYYITADILLKLTALPRLPESICIVTKAVMSLLGSSLDGATRLFFFFSTETLSFVLFLLFFFLVAI
jgi:16S rRNA (adenine1518-N6/adenine1519-N6)-dimethyltransferase